MRKARIYIKQINVSDSIALGEYPKGYIQTIGDVQARQCSISCSVPSYFHNRDSLPVWDVGRQPVYYYLGRTYAKLLLASAVGEYVWNVTWLDFISCKSCREIYSFNHKKGPSDYFFRFKIFVFNFVNWISSALTKALGGFVEMCPSIGRVCHSL